MATSRSLPSGSRPKPRAAGSQWAAVVGASVLTLGGLALDSSLFSGPPVATGATIVAIEGFHPATEESSEATIYVLTLTGGRSARLVSPKRHALGTQLIAMVSTSRLSGRLLVSSTYMLAPK